MKHLRNYVNCVIIYLVYIGVLFFRGGIFHLSNCNQGASPVIYILFMAPGWEKLIRLRVKLYETYVARKLLLLGRDRLSRRIKSMPKETVDFVTTTDMTESKEDKKMANFFESVKTLRNNLAETQRALRDKMINEQLEKIKAVMEKDMRGRLAEVEEGKMTQIPMGYKYSKGDIFLVWPTVRPVQLQDDLKEPDNFSELIKKALLEAGWEKDKESPDSVVLWLQ